MKNVIFGLIFIFISFLVGEVLLVLKPEKQIELEMPYPASYKSFPQIISINGVSVDYTRSKQ